MWNSVIHILNLILCLNLSLGVVMFTEERDRIGIILSQLTAFM
jgi:hypothetical protein